MSATFVPSELSDLAGTPMTSLGDVIYAGVAGVITRLAGPTSATKQFLTSTGTGTAANAPSWAVIAAADYPTMVGDSGTGGTKGAVPAPAAGDAAAGKYLKADGTWTTPPGGSGGSPGGATTNVQYNNAGAFAGDANLTYASATGTLTTKALAVAAAGGATTSPDVLFANANTIHPTVVWQSTTDGKGMRLYSYNGTAYTEVLRLQDNGAVLGTSLGTIGGMLLDNFALSRNSSDVITFGAAGQPALTFSTDTGTAYTYLVEFDAPTTSVPIAKLKLPTGSTQNFADFYVNTSLVASITSAGNFTGNAANVTGTVVIANGGTGATTQQAAINALTGAQSAGKYLRSDGTNATLASIVAADVPTLNQNTTGTAANVTGTVVIANGGTGQTTAAAGFNALSPLTTLGDTLYGGASGAGTRLAGNTTATKQFLTQTGTGSVSAAPSWAAIAAADVPVFVASGASHAPGSVPDPGSVAGSTKYLREDATWAVPAGGGGGTPGGTTNSVQYNTGSAFGGATNTAVGGSGNLQLATQSTPASPALGDFYHSSAQQALALYVGDTTADALKVHLNGCLFSQTADVTISNTTSATTLVGAGVGTTTLPANALVVGKVLVVEAEGTFSNSSGAAVNYAIAAKIGGQSIASQNVSVGNTGGGRWALRARFTCRAVGTSGTVRMDGTSEWRNGSGGSNVWYPLGAGSTATVATNGTLALDVQATLGTASVSATITCSQLTVTVLN